MKSWRAVLVQVSAVALALFDMPLASAASPGSAAELARAQSEERRIDSEFVTEVASAVGVPVASIERLLPAEPRIADRGKRLVQAIGKEIRVLNATESAAVLAADEKRRRALAGLRAR